MAAAFTCPRCWAASLDAARCRAAARWQRPPRGEAQLVALPCGATLRVLLTEAAASGAGASARSPALGLAASTACITATGRKNAMSGIPIFIFMFNCSRCLNNDI
jgi:hypothetical protein